MKLFPPSARGKKMLIKQKKSVHNISRSYWCHVRPVDQQGKEAFPNHSLLINKWERGGNGGEGNWKDKMISLQKRNQTFRLHQDRDQSFNPNPRLKSPTLALLFQDFLPRDLQPLEPLHSWR